MSMFWSSIYIKESNLFLIEFMFTRPKISLPGEPIFISFSPVLASKALVTDFDQSDHLSTVNHFSAYLQDLQNLPDKTTLKIRILT